MHIIPLHIGDWVQATAQFENVHLGIFLRLLTEYYKSEKALPDDPSELEWIAAAKTKIEKDALRLVLRRCFTHHADSKTYIQKRADREIEKFHQNGLEKRYAILCRHWQSINGDMERPTREQFTADPSRYYDETTRHIRKLSDRNTHVSQPNGSCSYTDGQVNYQPETSNQKPVTSNQNSTPIVPKGTESATAGDLDFIPDDPTPPTSPTGHPGSPKKQKATRAALQWTPETRAIYDAYPRKVAPDRALRAIQKRLDQGVPAAELLAAVQAYAKATAGTEREFIPHPATWFNDGRFADDPAEWVKAENPPQKKETGGPRGLPEPSADWRGRLARHFDSHITLPWSALMPAVQADAIRKLKSLASDA